MTIPLVTNRFIAAEITRQGYTVDFRDNIGYSDDDTAVNIIIATYDPIPDAKAEKVQAIKAEAGQRAAAIYEFITGDSDAIAFYQFAADLYLSISPGSREPLSGRLLEFKGVRDAGADAIVVVNALTTFEQVEAYDPVTDPAWP